jgi:hypothetical protein
VAAFAGASWPVRIALVLAALVLVGGYLLVQGRRHDAAPPADAAAPADAAPPADATPPTDAAPPARPRPEDPA